MPEDVCRKKKKKKTREANVQHDRYICMYISKHCMCVYTSEHACMKKGGHTDNHLAIAADEARLLPAVSRGAFAHHRLREGSR
jgi:hypothetical protein